jgi:transglutaminase-like putative cysteine protease
LPTINKRACSIINRKMNLRNTISRYVSLRSRAFYSLGGSVALCLLAVALVAIVVPRHVQAKNSFTVQPPPAWVETLTVASSPPTSPNDSAGQAIYLLFDDQVRVNSAATQHYERRVKKIFSSTGVEEAAQLKFDFEPSYEALVIHHIRILRGEQTIDALKPNEIKIINQEDELNQRLYNGRMSAVIFLSDVRAGDVIDYAYSINGDNPVLAGHFADSFILGSRFPIDKLRCRLLWPSARSLHFKNHNTELAPAVRQLGSDTEHVWEQTGVPAITSDDKTPDWFNPLPQIQLSEFASWDDVVRWALPLYKLQGALPPALTKQIAQWRDTLSQADARVIAALRFAQDEVRYTGIEMGPYSHLPNQPPVVFARRFGDCKDKSLLLATMLGALGIEAYPALVNTEAQHTVSEFQPTPFAFDHVIVQAKLDGRTYWLDPTITLQRGGLPEQYNPNYGRALVIRDGNGALEEIPPPTALALATTIKEVYTIADNSASAQLDVITTYHGMDADEIRYGLARQSITEVGRRFLNYYANDHPSIEALSPPRIDDDQAANVLMITERYRISDFLQDQSLTLGAYRINQEMVKPSISKRSTPLGIPFPANINQTIEVNLAEPLLIDNDAATVANEWLRFEYRCEVMGKTLRLNYAYQSLADHVPAARVKKYLEAVDQIQNRLGYALSLDHRNAAPKADSTLVGVTLLAVIFGPLIVFGIIKGVKSRQYKPRQTEFKQRQAVAQGAAPEVAIPLQHEADLSRHLRAFQCACGTPYDPQAALMHKDNIVFDGQRLVIVQLSCDVCRREQDVYFTQPLAEGRV